MLDKITQKLKDLFPKKKVGEQQPVEPSPAGSSPSKTELTPEEAKNKKRALIIKIVAGIAVLYFALDEFVLKKEKPEEVAPPVVTAKKHERKPKKSLKEMQKPEEMAKRDVSSVPPQATPETAKPEAPAPEPAASIPQPTEPAVTEPPPSEAVVPAVTETPPTEQPAPAVTETPPSEPVPAETPVAPEATETPSPAETTTPATESMGLSETPAVEKPTEEIAQDMQKVAEEVGPIPEGEIKPAAKVELPDYSTKGRGLVYNCTGKHWACIDRPGFLNCKEHMRWSEENKKSPECVIKNVYASEEDCSIVQLNYINTNEPTDFCK